MPAHRVKSFILVAALLVGGSLVLSGCGAAAPASVAMAAAAVEPVEGGTPTAGSVVTSTVPVAGISGPQRTITVVGQGQVKAKPDVARSQIGIEVMAPTVADATKEAQTRMDSVLKALKAAGVADKDIQTSNYSINFERQNPGIPSPKSTAPATTEGSYRVNNMVSVTIRDLSKVGSVIDAAVNAGANNVYGINFGLDSTVAQESQAREKAVVDARARAENLAKLNGISLGGIISVSEVIGGPSARFAVEAPMGMGGGGGTPVEPGEVNFSTQIQVVYAIQ